MPLYRVDLSIDEIFDEIDDDTIKQEFVSRFEPELVAIYTKITNGETSLAIEQVHEFLKDALGRAL